MTAPVSALALARSASNKKKGLTKGKITISRPILQENSGQNPLNKIAVMDLQEAAMADRERRVRMQEEEESMAVPRVAGPLMGMSPEEVLKRGVSLKRKEIASVSVRASVFPGFPGSLQPEDMAVASTTSAQLSPGGEETRRRSPRPSLGDESMQFRTPSPVRAPEPTKVRSESPQNLPSAVQRPLLRTDIRPSRMAPPSPEAPPPEPTKTPLQRRPTIGLPSNPRARGLKVVDEPGSQHKTILFVNNIEYNDPLAVEAIIKGAGNMSKPDSDDEPLGTAKSVVNRPRPIPRKPAESPAQATPSPGHRRSRSGGSLMGRKSLLASTAGSPTQLPPLPSLPKSAALPSRPQPNDTKSMTFEEKVTMMFPNPQSANAIKRRSSVPDVPRIPVSYLDMESSPSEAYDRARSDRTTKTSVRTESVLEVDEIPWRPGKAGVNTTDAAGSSWLRAFGNEDDGTKSRAAAASGKRGSSPIIPTVRASAWTETTYDRSEDDATNWSATNSPDFAADFPLVPRLGVPSSMRVPVGQDLRVSQVSTMADNRSRETLPIMLDTSTVGQADLQESPLSDVEVVATTPELPTWHRRVGDECPTFSGRKKTRSRKMSPPPPLSLNTVHTKKMVAIHVEPSPLESPGQAIQQIQAQLKNLEALEQATPQSASRRLALLDDLEREMGQQEEHWEEIKHDMGRDSLSSMQTMSPTGRDSRHASVASTMNMARNSIRQSIGTDRRASRIARMQNNANPKIPEPSVRDSRSPQLTKWQKRLTEAQMDYMDAQQLFRGSNVNFMQMSKQLLSPTPPDSDNSSGDEAPILPAIARVLVARKPSKVRHNPHTLWKPAAKEPAARTSLLWAPVSRPKQPTEAVLPGLSVRPAQRKVSAPLQIESSQLWRKPYSTTNRSASGLWRPVWASAAPPAQPVVRAPSKAPSTSQKPPRPLTQRPPRRNKRVTLLPDILESPEPLPDKRGTLGIFQFPWGEKSDTASMQPMRPSMYMAMPGTMTSGGPSGGMDARSRQLEQTEYSSSFFDDYDDEEDEDANETDSDEDSDGDEFDETTLWEIASLLKTDAVPSRDSLLPPPSGSVVYDYMEETPSDEEGRSSREQSIVIGLAAPQELLLEQQRDSATIESSTLLMLEEALEPSPPPKRAAGGLPANPKASLTAQVGRAAITPAPGLSQVPQRTAEVQKTETVRKQGSVGLWYPPGQADKHPVSKGLLFVPESSRAGSRGTSEEPAAKYTSRAPRPVEQKPLDRLTSTQLWAPAGSKTSQRNWISGAGHHGTKLHRPRATATDWKAALNEAIAASYPPTKQPKRVSATPAEWNAALQEAVSLSRRPNPAPIPAPTSRHDSIQAQIEALEQERLFVERAAQEEYRRRTAFSSSSAAATMAIPADPVPVAVIDPIETLQDLQRRMSMQIRQSLVFAKPSAAAEPVRSTPVPRTTTTAPKAHVSPFLWTPTKPTTAPVVSTGLWTPAAKHATPPSGAWAEEDGEAAAQRARRRRVVQRKVRRSEIRAQIAAVERGANPFVDFGGMGLWVRGVERSVGGRGRDWLGEVCVVRRTRGVVLRY